jgi:hypothetical protein
MYQKKVSDNFQSYKTMDSTEELTPNELKKKAYLMALRLRSSGLDAETVYARLEKQGIPEELARQVAYDTIVEIKRGEEIEQAVTDYNGALARIGIAAAAAIVYNLIFQGIYIPIGIIAGGIVSALFAKKKMKE